MNESQTTTPEQLHLSWETRIRVLINPSIWTSMLLVLGIPSLLLGIFLAIIAKRPEFGIYVPLIAMAVLLGIFVPVALVIDLCGGFKVTFFLTSHGVRSVAGKGPQAVSTVAILMGAFAGKPGVTGAGLLARSEQDVFIPWQAITKIQVKPRRRFITVKREWGFKPIALYCTPENFPQAMEVFTYYAKDKMPK